MSWPESPKQEWLLWVRLRVRKPFPANEDHVRVEPGVVRGHVHLDNPMRIGIGLDPCFSAEVGHDVNTIGSYGQVTGL